MDKQQIQQIQIELGVDEPQLQFLRIDRNGVCEERGLLDSGSDPRLRQVSHCQAQFIEIVEAIDDHWLGKAEVYSSENQYQSQKVLCLNRCRNLKSPKGTQVQAVRFDAEGKIAAYISIPEDLPLDVARLPSKSMLFILKVLRIMQAKFNPA